MRNIIEKENERELLGRLAEGDNSAFDIIFRTYYQPLCYFAEKLTQETAVAQDMAADCFFKVLQQKRGFPSIAALRSFLYTVVRNNCLDYIKTQKRHTAGNEELGLLATHTDESIERQIIMTEVLASINRSIKELPEKYREIMELALIEGMKNEDIAAKLGIAHQTVRNHKSAALKLLRYAITGRDDLSAITLFYCLWYLERFL